MQQYNRYIKEIAELQETLKEILDEVHNDLTPKDLASRSDVVSFYSEPMYTKLYYYFFIDPQTNLDHIPIKFKNANQEI